MTGVLIRRQPCEDRDTRGQRRVMMKAETGVCCTSQERQELTVAHCKLGRDREGFPCRSQGQHGLVSSLILNF